jgi:hypothetical protein
MIPKRTSFGEAQLWHAPSGGVESERRARPRGTVCPNLAAPAPPAGGRSGTEVLPQAPADGALEAKPSEPKRSDGL